MSNTQCRHFTGYKPCGLNPVCDTQCPKNAPIGTRVLLIHLQALGAVLRSTSLLSAIHRRYPNAHVTWVCQSPAQSLLENLDSVDRVMTLSAEDQLKISGLEFDVALTVDKSLVTTGLLKLTRVKKIYGFITDPWNGAVLPATSAAQELWEIGLSDTKKFFMNKKSEQQLVHESLELGPYVRDEYKICLSESERSLVQKRRNLWSPDHHPIIGINTGCSATLPHKKLSLEGHRTLVAQILRHPKLSHLPVVLLGGPEDSERNALIGRGLPVIQSPTQQGLRDGLVSVAACDLVVTGDSLGMHMAIGLKKWVVAWFGPSVSHEIDLYQRGQKILTAAPCSPCWKRVCQKSNMCYDQVDFKHVTQALEEGMQWLTLSSKPPSPETFFSPSPF